MIGLSNSKKPVVLALGFRGVVDSEELSFPLGENELILLKYMRGQIDTRTAINEFQNLDIVMSEYRLTELVRESGWSTIYEEAGADTFKIEFEETLYKIRSEFPEIKIGFVVDEPIQFNEMLKKIGIRDGLDFVINRRLCGPSQEFNPGEEIIETLGDSRIIFVDKDFDTSEVSGHEVIIHDEHSSNYNLYRELIQDTQPAKVSLSSTVINYLTNC